MSAAATPSLSSLSISDTTSNTTTAITTACDEQLKQILPTLSSWQRECAEGLLTNKSTSPAAPSRLRIRLEAYLRNVEDVAEFARQQAIAASSSSATVEDGRATNAVSPASSTSAAAAASSSASRTTQLLVAPSLSHTSFRSCLLDNILLLLEEECESLFTQCELTTSDGKRISKNERMSKGLNTGNLTYGEISFKSLGEILWYHLPDLKIGSSFVDLGSGTGRGVIAASYLFPFNKLIGIEILEGLHNAALEVYHVYNDTVRSQYPDSHIRSRQAMHFYCASFLDNHSSTTTSWYDCDLIFANSTCFDEELMLALEEHCQKVRDGAYIVTLTKTLESPYYKLVYAEQHQMSWGAATVNIMRKCTPTKEELDAAAAEKEKASVKHVRRYRGTELD